MTTPATQHRPVLLRETVQGLQLAPGLRVVDGTVGAAGHSREIWPRISPGGRLIGLDRDATMLARAEERLKELATPEQQPYLPPGCLLVQASYAWLDSVLEQWKITGVDRILLDLGLSSDQLGDSDRGFGFQTDGLLDMRFDPGRGEPAHVWMYTATVAEITRALTDFGEEPFAAEIAERIVVQRKIDHIRRASQLMQLVDEVYRRRGERGQKSHPATRTFQALRIQVNAELEHLQRFLTEIAPQFLVPEGILAIITFHSLEDRIVKQAFLDRSIWASSSKKPITPSPLEVKMNPRCRSAKLRIAIRADQEIDHIS